MMRRQRILFLLIVAGIALLTVACSDNGGVVNSDKGRVRIVMSAGADTAAAGQTDAGSMSPQSGSTAAPVSGDHDDDGGDAVPRLKQANVTFSSVLARNLDGQLIDVAMDLPRTIDMLGFANGGTVDLPAGFLPPGMYDQLVVVMTEVQFVLLNDTKITITPPLGGWTAIIAVRPRPFEVIEGQTTTVRLKFFPGRLFRENGDGFHFNPEFEMDD